ncbi:MAG: hypothetical protein Alpg2KO_07480 [Alphaproteobacteria bacterium]
MARIFRALTSVDPVSSQLKGWFMSDKSRRNTDPDLANIDPRLIEAAEMAVPLALNWAGKKLGEAFDRFKQRFEEETGNEFDAVEPTEAAVTNNQAFVDRVPADAADFSDELRDRLVHGGSRVDTIMSDSSMTWDGKGLDAFPVQQARAKLGMMTVDLRGASLANADFRGVTPDFSSVDLSGALGGNSTGVRVSTSETRSSRKPEPTHRGPSLPGHGGKL